MSSGVPSLDAATDGQSRFQLMAATTSEDIIPREVLFGNPKYAGTSIFSLIASNFVGNATYLQCAFVSDIVQYISKKFLRASFFLVNNHCYFLQHQSWAPMESILPF
jgi:hypothetical protein